MALRRCTKRIDGTIPVQALLYSDEELLASQESVGIYDGQQKAPNHQSGVVHVSTHRLFYIDGSNELGNSFTVDLSLVVQTDYYAGLFKSSPKVTLHVRSCPSRDAEAVDEYRSWECEVCGFKNPPGLSPSAARVCSLCGVPKSSVPSASHLSTSLPSSPRAPPVPPSDSAVACPACTFLNHPSLPSSPTSRPESPIDDDDDDDDDDSDAARIIKLSFRKGGDKPFYAAMKRSLMGKTWQIREMAQGKSQAEDPTHGKSRDAISRMGISGVLHNVQTSAQGEQDHLNAALQDLEAFAAKAKDMVRLAAQLNEKLTAASSTTITTLASDSLSSSSSAPAVTLSPSTEPEEATFIRSSLSQLGMHMSNAPVTLDMMKNEQKWMEELARELAGVLQGNSTEPGSGIMKKRGVIALDEVWGGWNRARGVALIPPSTFLQVIPLLSIYTNPSIHVRTLGSGLTVLHTPLYTSAAFASRLAGFLSLIGPQTIVDIAVEEGLTVSLVNEMVEAVESDGHIVRDDANAAITGGGGVGGAQLKWWINMFGGYTWDGQE